MTVPEKASHLAKSHLSRFDGRSFALYNKMWTHPSSSSPFWWLSAFLLSCSRLRHLLRPCGWRVTSGQLYWERRKTQEWFISYSSHGISRSQQWLKICIRPLGKQLKYFIKTKPINDICYEKLIWFEILNKHSIMYHLIDNRDTQELLKSEIYWFLINFE